MKKQIQKSPLVHFHTNNDILNKKLPIHMYTASLQHSVIESHIIDLWLFPFFLEVHIAFYLQLVQA